MYVLQTTKARLKVSDEQLKALEWEHEVLEQRFAKVQLLNTLKIHILIITRSVTLPFSHLPCYM